MSPKQSPYVTKKNLLMTPKQPLCVIKTTSLRHQNYLLTSPKQPPQVTKTTSSCYQKNLLTSQNNLLTSTGDVTALIPTSPLVVYSQHASLPFSAHREICSKSYQIKQKSDCIYHFPINLEPNGRVVSKIFISVQLPANMDVKTLSNL